MTEDAIKYRVKIYGAGSIGNHLAHASRQLGWDVLVCDVSEEALHRMKNEIYPGRYGQWDQDIHLCNSRVAPQGEFDLIFVGTPPDSHLPLAIQALEENPKAILVEKPLCPPGLEHAQEFYEAVKTSSTKVFVGYNHIIGKATRKTEELLNIGVIGEVQTLDVEFREHWGGIFAAHPWLEGPHDSYLGYWKQGGGAAGEHSHAVNLWQHLAHVVNGGRVTELSAMLRYVRQGPAEYDQLCFLDLKTENGLVGRVVQDVVTVPHRKRAKIQGSEGAIEWINDYNLEGDAVILSRPAGSPEVTLIPNKRSDDFTEELKHLRDQLAGCATPSGICLERGLDTMLILAGAHKSESLKCRVHFDYSKGYSLPAVQPIYP